MPHNGKVTQGNMTWGVYWGAGCEFINVAKLITWNFPPDGVNANGYPTVATSGQGQYWFPTQTQRPGQYIVEWTGDVHVDSNYFTGTITSGSTSPTGSPGSKHGTFTFTPGDPGDVLVSSDNLGFNTMNLSEPMTYLAIFHVDDLVAFRAGEVFTQHGIDAHKDYGVLRTLDSKFHNDSMVCRWEHEHPETAISYGTPRCVPGKFFGTTTGGGSNTFALAKTGFTLSDKTSFHFKWNAAPSSITEGPGITLNVNGTGAKEIIGVQTYLYPVDVPAANTYAIAVYDASLDKYFVQNTTGWMSGWPSSLILKFCQKIGAHPWFPGYHMGLDTTDTNGTSDYLSSLATLCKAYTENPANDAAWMVPRFETPNETWPDGGGGFVSTFYGIAKASARAGWGATGCNSWIGLVNYNMGRTLEAVYGEKAWANGKYQHICGVWWLQGFDGIGAEIAVRLAGKSVSVDGHTPGLSWVSNICPAIYWGIVYTDQEAIDAYYTYPTLSVGAAQQSAVDAFAAVHETDAYIQLAANLKNFRNICANNAGLGVTDHTIQLTSYEGGLGVDNFTGPGSNYSASITAATKAASCVLTLDTSKAVPAVGAGIYVSSVGGMTQLNNTSPTLVTNITKASSAVVTVTGAVPAVGQMILFGLVQPWYGSMTEISYRTAKVTGVSGQDLTINLDTTGFHAFGGVDPLTARYGWEVTARNTTTHTVTIAKDTSGASTYTSGGTAEFGSSGLNRVAFHTKLKDAAPIARIMPRVWTNYLLNGGIWPSKFDIGFGTGAWVALKTPFAPWVEGQAIKDFGNATKPLKLKITTS